MNLSFSPIIDTLYNIKLDIDPSITELLEQEDWQLCFTGEVLEKLGPRHQIPNFKNQSLKEIQDWFKGDVFKGILLSLLWKNDRFQQMWDGQRIKYDKMFDKLIVRASLTKDSPGYNSDLHLEHRTQVAFGIIYFMSKDDPAISTYFYDAPSRSNKIRIPTTFGSGWLCVNNDKGWHEGFNNSDYDRYSIGFSLEFDVF